jgi:hypothetical protein
VSGETTPQARLRALAATATIGTDRLGGDATAVDTLLTEAAACSLRARAGWRPQVHTGSLAPCPPDDRAVAPARAMARLHMLLAERDAGLIEEWATLAASHAMRVDGASAPLLLDWAHQAKRPAAVFAALGRMGEWLASLNPDWQNRSAAPAIPADADTLWQTGTKAERIALLLSVQGNDPSRAWALVASTWKDDAAADRVKFVELLQEDASMTEEPFLDASLDDRSKLVRQSVAAALLRVPGSRWRQRMSAVARRFISVQTSGLLRKRIAITLTPPESFDPAWERDGIERQPPKGVGQRAWWLRLILVSADLAIWKDITGLTPAAVLEALQGDDFGGDAVSVLLDAARLARDPEWCAALARHLMKQAPVQIDIVGSLIQALGDADAEPLAMEIVAADSLDTIERWVVLAAIDRPWSLAFSRDVMTVLTDHTPRLMDAASFRAPLLVAAVSRHLEPRAVDYFERAVTRSFGALKDNTTGRHLDRVRVRAEMREEFSS